MFDFFDELFGEIKKGSYRYQVDCGKKIVVEGYKNIQKIEAESVVLKLFDGEMEIRGKDLKVSEFLAKTISITGQICTVEVTTKASRESAK